MTEAVQEAEFRKRQAYIQSLKRFLAEQQEQISKTLETLGWSPEHFIKPQNRVVCPVDNSHVMPEESLAEHVRKCQLLKSGVQKYQLEDVMNEESRVKNNLTNTVKLDEATLNSILWDNAVAHGHVYTGQRKLPTTHEDEKVILSPQERLAVHDYIASEAKSLGLMMNVEKDDNLTTDWEKIIKKGVLQKDDDESMTVIEKLAALRDFKRRRQSYRAKNVHITKKSYTEIIHEVIGNQMEMWGAEMKGKTGGQKDSEGHGSDIYIKDRQDRGEDRPGGHSDRRDQYEKEERDGHHERDRYREAERGYERYRERRSYKEYDRGYDYKDYRDRYEQGPSRKDSDRERGESRRDSDRDGYRDRAESRRDREGDRDRNRDRDRYRDRHREGEKYRDRESESDGNRYREREGRRDEERDRPREGEKDRGRGDYVREGERERDSWKESGRWERSYDTSEGQDRERDKSYERGWRGREERGSGGREEGRSRLDDLDDIKGERSREEVASLKRDPTPEKERSTSQRRNSKEDEYKMRRGSIKAEVQTQETEGERSRDMENYTQESSKESSKRQRSRGRDGSKERKKAKTFQETVKIKSSVQRETISQGEAREITVEHSSRRDVEGNDSDINNKTDRAKESKHKHKKSKKSKKHKHKHKHKHRKRSNSTASESGQSQESD